MTLTIIARLDFLQLSMFIKIKETSLLIQKDEIGYQFATLAPFKISTKIKTIYVHEQWKSF